MLPHTVGGMRQLLPMAEFARLSAAEQRAYLRDLAEHLGEATRVHTEKTHPRLIPDNGPPDKKP